MVGCMFRHITCKLSNLDLLDKFTFKAGVHDFALSRFEPVHHVRNGSNIRRHRKQNQLFVHEVRQAQFVNVHVKISVWFNIFHPFLAISSSLLAECEVDGFVVLFAFPHELNLVAIQLCEVLFGFFCRAGTQTLVILDFPAFTFVVLFLPFFILWESVERLFFLAFSDFDDGSDKLDQKTGDLEERGPEGREEVDHEAFDM
mmetsp:Transcript_16770/g.32691  ORF Transcript_16770/g.32691 Transcript_16770/m.32691 type:complete len:201 (-) Transcript_16770:672-1274(-)